MNMPETEAEFAAMVERHRRELHIHCYRMLASFDEAEDAVQETLLRAWRARDTLASVDNLRPWLYRIATNTCLDLIKSRRRQLERLDSLAEVPWLQPYPDQLLDETVERETIELAFLAVIQLLPPAQRAALILREVAGWSANETAELLELSVPAVNSALQRARATLRERLPSEGRELWAVPEASEDERRALEGFIDAHQRGDTEAALELIADDVRVTMPPNELVFDGREAVVPLIERAHSGVEGDWRLVPTGGQPPAGRGQLPARARRRPLPRLQARRPAGRERQDRRADHLRRRPLPRVRAARAARPMSFSPTVV